jgi:cytochrome c biogenesis protein
MRTALYILFSLAVASIIASLVPQTKNEPAVADRFQNDHVLWGKVFRVLGFFDVFGSWWFQGLLALLIFVLVACLLPRTAALFRQRRSISRPPRVGRFPGSGRRTSMETTLSGDEAVAAARRALRGYQLSGVNEARQFIGEKGFARETGSLIFHWSFLVLIVGAALTVGFGFRGQAIIVEGERWTEDRANYTYYAPGRFFADDDHRGFVIELDSFGVTYGLPNGGASDYVSHVKVFDQGRQVEERNIRVNDPLVYGGLKFYQASYGWAPVVRVSKGAEVLYEGPVVSVNRGPGGSSEGTLRFRGEGTAFLLDFYPDPILAPGKDGPEPANLSDVPGGSAGRSVGSQKAFGFPVMVVRAFTGAIGDAPANVFTLDTNGLQPAGGDLVVPADVALAAGGQLKSASIAFQGLSVELLDLKRFTVLAVKADPGVPVVGLAAALILLGLVPSLYAWRRRLWVHVIERDGEATLVELGGVAYQRKERFDEEFTTVALRLRENLPPVPEKAPV